MWARVEALAVAVDAFLAAGMTDHARPLVAEFVGLARHVRGPSADVVPLG